MGESRFGDYLSQLLRGRECSGSWLAGMMSVDPALVYRWLRNESVPKLDAPYREEMSRYLSLSEEEAALLKAAQVYSLSQPAERRPRPRNGGAVESLIRHARPRNTPVAAPAAPLPTLPTAPIRSSGVIWGRPAILEAIIRALEGLPSLPARHHPNSVLLSFQGPEDAFDDFPDLQAHYQQAILGALQRGWRIEHVLRLDHDARRSVLLVEGMLKLLGTGRYLPVYIEQPGTLAPPYDLLVIPQTLGLLVFATQNPRRADAALLTYDLEQIELLRTHFYQLSALSVPLVQSHIIQDDTAVLHIYADAEAGPGGRMAVKDKLSSLTEPPSWYQKDSLLMQAAERMGAPVSGLIEQQRRRLAAFYAHAQTSSYRDICTRRRIEQMLHTGMHQYNDRISDVCLPWEERIEQLEQTIHLLKTYERYELALIDSAEEQLIPTETSWEVTGKGTVLMMSWCDDDSGEEISVTLEIAEPTIVHAFRAYFEDLWERIAPRNKDKRQVIAWLEEQIRRFDERRAG